MLPFRMLLRVRYYECDAQYVVFNARYADYADTAVTEFFGHAVGGYKGMLERNMDNQVVRLATDWQSPARFDDVLAISVETLRVGTTSFTLSLVFQQYPSGQAVAKSEITYVLVSADRHQKMAVPDDFRKQLLAGAPNQIVNFAGVSYEAES
ncbi:MAG: thioesterase family protein [Cellvibrionaceae bacterium]